MLSVERDMAVPRNLILRDFLKRVYRTGLGLPPLKKGGTAMLHFAVKQVSFFPEIALFHCPHLSQQRPHLGIIRFQRRQAPGVIARRVEVAGVPLKRHQRQ